VYESEREKEEEDGEEEKREASRIPCHSFSVVMSRRGAALLLLHADMDEYKWGESTCCHSGLR
jgi:hypothetical protein